MSRKRRSSRSDRWTEAVIKVQAVVGNIEMYLDDLDSALAELRSIQEEYEGWKDNLPENLASTPLGEKLEVVCELSIDSAGGDLRSAIEDLQSLMEEADGVEFPQGFGRD